MLFAASWPKDSDDDKTATGTTRASRSKVSKEDILAFIPSSGDVLLGVVVKQFAGKSEDGKTSRITIRKHLDQLKTDGKIVESGTRKKTSFKLA